MASILDYLKENLNPMGNGAVGRAIDTAGNAIRTDPILHAVNQYGQTHLIDPAAEGIANYQVRPDVGTALGAAGGVAQSFFNSLPTTALANNLGSIGINTVAGGAQGARTGQGFLQGAGQGILQNNQDVAGGIGVTNPYIAAPLNFAAQTLAYNPRGVIAGASNLQNLSKQASTLENLGVLAKTAGNTLGLVHPENPLSQDLRTVGSGINDFGKNAFQSVKNTNDQSNLKSAAQLFDNGTQYEAIRNQQGQFQTPSNFELIPRKVSLSEFEKNARAGTIDKLGINPQTKQPHFVEPMLNMENRPSVTVYINPETGKPLAASGDPVFANYLQDSANGGTTKDFTTYQKNLEARKIQKDAPLSPEEMKAAVSNPTTQFRGEDGGVYYHVSPQKNTEGILKKGLIPGAGDNGSGATKNNLSNGVSLYKDFAPAQSLAENLNQIGEPASIFRVKLSPQEEQALGQDISGFPRVIGKVSPDSVNLIGPSSSNAPLSMAELKKGLLSPQTQFRSKESNGVKVYGFDKSGKFGPVSEDSAKGIVSSQARQQGLPDDPLVTGPRTETEALPLKQAAEVARRNMSSVSQMLQQRGQNIASFLEKNVAKEDVAKFYDAVEHPEDIAKLAQQSKNPEKFIDSVVKTKKLLDDADSIRKSVGLGASVKDYLPHDYIVNNPEAAKAYLEEIAQQRGLSGKAAENFVAQSSKERVFPDLRSAQSVVDSEGKQVFQQNENVGDVFRKYFSQQGLEAGNAAMTKTLETFAPGHIDTSGTISPGAIQLRAKGLGSTTVSKDLFPFLKGLEPDVLSNNKLVKGVDEASAALKETALGLGGFHGLKLTSRAIGAQLLEGKLPRVDQAVVNFLSQDARTNYKLKMIDNGTVDWLSKAGGTLSSGGDQVALQKDIIATAKSLNPIKKFSDALFNGLGDTYKLQIANIFKERGIDPGSTEGKKIGAEINNLFGGLNLKVLNRDKTVQQIARFVALAPDLNEGKLRATARALNITDWGQGANLARAGLAGEALVAGLGVELARRVLTGSFSDSLKNVVMNDILDPNFPLPPAFNKPGDNRQQVAKMPGSNITDIARAIEDPKHFVTARSNSLLSLGNKAINNEDYYGRQVYDPQDSLIKKGLKLAQSELPIPAVQGIAAAQGKESIPSAILNTLGARVSTDPNDPSLLVAKARGQFRDTLNQQDRQAYDLLHPATKDAQGDSLGSKDQLASPEKASIYLSHPDFLAADSAAAKAAGGNQDPFFTKLTPEQQRLVLAAQVKIPGQTSSYSTLLKQQPWYNGFQQARDSFYAGLPKSTTTPSGNPTSLGNYNPLTVSPDLQKKLDQYNSLPSAAARSVFLSTNQDVSQYFKANSQNQLNALGLPATQPSTGFGGGAGSLGTTSNGGTVGTVASKLRISTRGGGGGRSLKAHTGSIKTGGGLSKGAGSKLKVNTGGHAVATKSIKLASAKLPSNSFSKDMVKVKRPGKGGAGGGKSRQLRLASF